MKSTLTLLTGLLLAPLAVLQAADAPKPSAKPNVVFILADDLGWADTTLNGHTTLYRTPNLERLAKRGMTFSRAYSASPLCSPTRSAIMTGLSPARTGITVPGCHVPEATLEAFLASKAPPEEKVLQPCSVTRLKTDYRTLAEALKEEGYATGHFGKWHLGREPYTPLQQGFDVDVPHWPGPGPAGSYVAPWKFAKFKERKPGEHLEDRMADEAAAWLERVKDRPFYLNYWMFSVHSPFDAKSDYIERCAERIDTNDLQRCAVYAAMVQSMDDAVGRLLDTLDRLGVANNTIVIFTSDNGGNAHTDLGGFPPTSNRPLRGGKGTLYDGGTRVPCVVAWPGHVEAGARSDAVVQSEDYYPTLLEALGLKPAPGQRFDGVSVLPAWRGEPFERGAVFQYFPHSPLLPDWLPPAVSVHRGDWKLIRIFHGGEQGAHRYLLFNLRDDLGEKNNLAAAKPELVAELDGLIAKFLADTKAVVPVPNPAFDPARYDPTQEGRAPLRKEPGAISAAASRAQTYQKAPPVKGIAAAPVREWVKRIEQLAPAQATVQPSGKRTVLLFSLATGVQHPVRAYVAEAIKVLGAKSGAFTVVESQDIESFAPENLAKFDAVILNSCCPNPKYRDLFLDVLNNEVDPAIKDIGLKYKALAPTQRQQKATEFEKNLIDYVAGGKGLVSVHGSIAFQNNSAAVSEMVGASFDFHPKVQLLTLNLVDSAHPLVAGFKGEGFIHSDELYIFKSANPKITFRPLLEADARKLDAASAKNPKIAQKGHLYVSWIKAHGKGRVFYVSPGHYPQSYENASILRFYLDGIQYALGDLTCDDKPLQ